MGAGGRRGSRRSGSPAAGGSAPEVVYGRNPVRELLRAGRREPIEIRALSSVLAEPWLEAAPVGLREASRDELSRFAGSPDHQGVAARVEPYPDVAIRDLVEAPGPVVCLDGAHDPRNVGAVARVLEGVGGAGLVIPARGGPGITPVVCKASAGAVEYLRIVRAKSVLDAINQLSGAGRPVIGADETSGTDYRRADPSRDLVLVVGAEGEGLRPRVRQACDQLVRIPMRGLVDSLNLSVAAGILLFRLAE